jgi:diguanylate cyclase (GGDEF)-like protein
MLTESFLRIFETQPKGRIVRLAWLFVLLAALLDYLTGQVAVFDTFYLVSVLLTSWFVSRRTGLLFAVGGAVASYFVNELSASRLQFVHLWNFAMRLIIFLFIAQLLLLLRKRLENETSLARTDFLTGVGNARAFFDQAEMELSRSRRYRHPLTIAYVDLDNFKKVNDTMGHSEGDKVLTTVANTMRRTLRGSDFPARLGGDEFAILLPETDYAQSQVIAQRLRTQLLEASKAHNWPVTFSMGVLTCPEPPPSIKTLIDEADALMYKVKTAGKNAIRHSVFKETAQPDLSRVE